MRFLYPLTIFLSAFLLFQVQPIITRIILPWFGGSAAVWTVCLLFFQVVLLLGYLYAHCLTRYLPSNRQKIVHIALLAVSLFVLPISPNAALKPAGGDDPTFKILLLLLLTVGLPYFLVSTTGPLLQAWYASRRLRPNEKEVSPYRLYALSNIGSMLALLSYPALVEPMLTTKQQALSWSAGYGLFVVLCGLTAWRLPSAVTSPVDLPISEKSTSTDEQGGDSAEVSPTKPGLGMHLLWCALAACSTMLLLAVTTHLSQDVAAIPFLWIAPLSLYLLSFIVCFAGQSWEWPRSFLAFPALAIGGMAFGLWHEASRLNIYLLIEIFSLGLFVCCMLCHGELARLKPAPRYLTSFYLMISLGGASGGVFVGLIAPHLFPNYYELPIAISACAVFAVALLYRETTLNWRNGLSLAALAALTLWLINFFVDDTREDNKTYRLTKRNFYGVLRISEDGLTRTLMYGTIRHGVQYLSDKRHMEPISYYSKESGLGLAMELIQDRKNRKVGVIGLGTGTIAAYGQPGDLYQFYEINPLVLQIANSEFRFLKDSKAKTQVIMSDARLSLESELPQSFDILAVDAFSGDAIPVHLLTKEAFALYFRHLKPDGILAVHVSNRYLNLLPVVRQLADSSGKTARLVENDEDDDNEISAADWVLVTNRADILDTPELADNYTDIQPVKGLRTWTDDYSNLFQILKKDN